MAGGKKPTTSAVLANLWAEIKTSALTMTKYEY
jgi:hypothetical protein